MKLHGTISVGPHTICTWEANRASRDGDWGCVVRVYDATAPESETFDYFRRDHLPADDVLAAAAAVLAEAVRRREAGEG